MTNPDPSEGGERLHAPEFAIGPDGAPRSGRFGDIYFALEDGLAETRTVFLEANGLPGRWRGRPRFCVAELGFGTGLNIAALLDLWRREGPAGAWLSVFTIDKGPLDARDARAALSRWPELAPAAEPLLAAWPPPAPGFHHRRLPDLRCALTIAHGEAAAMLAAADFAADAWFLDGFAPAKNPAMWSEAVFAQMARLSAPGATFGTYTAAGAVRRGLAGAGFEVVKAPGHGRKRERLTGRLAEAPAPPRPSLLPRARHGPTTRALIVGAGIAGAMTARALAEAGIETAVIAGPLEGDPGRAPPAASGNRAALVSPRLDLGQNPAARFNRAAFLRAVAAYERLPGEAFIARGAVRRLPPERAARREALMEAAGWPEDWLALEGEGGLMALKGGLVDPAAVRRAALAGVRVGDGVAASLVRAGDGLWRAQGDRSNVLAEAETAIIASGPMAGGFAQTAWLPLEVTGGRVSHAPYGGPARPALTDGDYAGFVRGEALFGASHHKIALKDALAAAEAGADARDDAANLERLRALAPDAAALTDPNGLDGRTSFRAALPDRLPVCGPVPDAEAYLERFDGLRTGRPPDPDGPPAPMLEGLYVIAGLGARGFVTAPLLADALAAEIAGLIAPWEQDVADALHPARFLLRALKRNAPLRVRP